MLRRLSLSKNSELRGCFLWVFLDIGRRKKNATLIRVRPFATANMEVITGTNSPLACSTVLNVPRNDVPFIAEFKFGMVDELLRYKGNKMLQEVLR